MEDEDKLLLKLKKSFFGGSLNIFLKTEDISLMTWDWQQKFIDATINSKLVKEYPTSKRFTGLFLKKIIDYLEGNQDVHDDFYSHLCLTMNDAPKDSFCYRHYLINNYEEVITIKETNKMVVNGTTGMRTWEAAVLLADWALCNNGTFTNKVILELGSGVGFTGITIGKLCKPKIMYLSDSHPDVINAICDNIRINFPQSEITESNSIQLFKDDGRIFGVMPLDWNNLDDLPNSVIPDVMIGADIVYDPLILQPLCNVLKKLLERNNQLEIFIASVIRNEETFQMFLEHLDNMNFIYQKLIMKQSVFIDWDPTIKKCLLKIKSI